MSTAPSPAPPGGPAPADPRSGDAPAVTPTVRRLLRRTRLWIAVVAAVLVVATVWALTVNGSRGTDALGADNPGPSGGMALAQVLSGQGVDVITAASLDEVRQAATAPEQTTILLFDSGSLLSADRLGRLGELADRLVVIAPNIDVLDAYAPSVTFSGATDAGAPLSPECSLPAATRAGAVTPGRSTFRPAEGGAAGALFCYPDDSGSFQLARTDSGRTAVTLLADSEPFDNEHIASDGNAALALNLLGEREHLIWYLPTFLDLADAGAGGQPSLAQLTPEWVTPVLVLFLAVFLAAALWRGRRLGPLVVEDLPVIVRSRETMEGRARLYQRSSARRRALDALRIGSIGRLASTLGLARTASVEDVVRASAAATGRPADEVRELLLDADPGSDAALVDLSDRLLTLEADVRTAVDPRSTHPRRPERMDS
ncbi:MAG: hypothetical protein JWR33_1130 [Naasia sp.]|jgi:hypothetical protein|uniref:DUF4350 domain-containing protein n=1 Tax=Naasia sp. TaxID=2546198 RepID=UPI002631219E|nr:DUF4350 domain-containing protein [Naasia sp.]MCU1570389.1 hypothetical protein [Naasia sp.]